jgi:prepilin peptidase CpaA
LTALLPTIALAFFSLTIIWAGIGDIATMRIPNRLILAMLLGFAVLAPLAGLSPSQAAWGLASACIVFCLALGPFALGWMGGGDVKLMAVAALWLGLPQLPAFLLWTALSGAFLTLAMIVFRSLPLSGAVAGRAGWVSHLHLDKNRVPYGVAIASASLIVLSSSPWMALR